jgi:radical SAM superfamily enzyme YgiQ (UPF0313 family)
VSHPDILLTTLNARYIHSALGLRYLMANLGELQPRARLVEFSINQRPVDIAEQIIADAPRIVGIGCYIWNITQVTELCALLKSLQPALCIVLGGPEVSHETEQSPAYAYADHVIQGQADLEFARLCRSILGDQPQPRVIDAPSPEPSKLTLPYALYNEEDIRQRVIYVEASRGCPYKCEFCLSALDRSAQPFDLDQFLGEIERLYARGARSFKFVDRTFNLNTRISQRILQFFLDRPTGDLFLHFELIPDRLPAALKTLIERFPPGCLQFEIGVQSFNQEVQQRISRRQDHQRTLDNLRYLTTQTRVHLHADLIAGLPGEDLASFAHGFNLLVSLGVQEIQLGILKRLRGAPICRHSDEFAMVFSPVAPYEVLSTSALDAPTLFRVKRFARYWDLLANSGRFRHSLPLLLAAQPFENFMAFGDWLFASCGQTHRISLPRLFRLLHDYRNDDQFVEALRADYANSGQKGLFEQCINLAPATTTRKATAAARQQRHIHQ